MTSSSTPSSPAAVGGRVRLHTLGRVGVELGRLGDDDGLVSQTKRMAVLVYLCAARPRGMRQRDELAAMFWPDFDQSRARSALRGAVHRLRRVLGSEGIVGRGDEQIGVDGSYVWCDAVAMEDAVATGDDAAALELYQGDFLTGFHVADAPAFEEWASRERTRFRALACEAAAARARQFVDANDLDSAISTERRALEIDPMHEPSLRRMLELLGTTGDRARALFVADEFEARLGAEFGAVLSPETRAIVQRLRAGLPWSVGAPVSESRSTPSIAVPDESATSVNASTTPPRVAPVRNTSGGEQARAASTATIAGPRRRYLRLWGSVAALALAATAATGLFLRKTTSANAADGRADAARVYIAPFELLARDDSTGRVLALMAADWIVEGLSSVGGPALVVENARALDRERALAEAERRDATLAVLGRVYRDGPRLVVSSELVAVPGGRVVRTHPTIVVPDTSLVTGADSLRRLAMASVATAVDAPSWGRPAGQRHLPSYESYRTYVAARDAERLRNRELAAQLFERAIELDTAFTEPLRGLIGVRITMGEWGVADSLLTILEARHRTEPRDVQLSDAILRARLHGDTRESLRAAEALIAEGPVKRSHLQVYTEASIRMAAGHLREAVALFDASPGAGSARDGSHAYWITFGNTLHLLGDHERELEVARRGLKEFPDNLGINGGVIRAFAALGREAELLRLLDDVTVAADGPGTWTPGSVLMIAAREAWAHGLPNVEREARRRLIADWRRHPREARARESVYFGFSMLLAGAAAWPELAEQSELRLSTDSMTVAWHGFRGTAAAMLGDTARALAEDRWLATRTDAQLRKSLAYVSPWGERAGMRARIAVALGDRERGVTLLREAVARGYIINVEFHSDPIFRAIADDPRVRELTEPR